MKRWLIVLVALLQSPFSFSQILEKQKQITFGNRIKNPIELEISRTKEELTFSAKNKSTYPYELDLEFTVFQNLSPFMKTYNTTLHPGNNRLFKLRIQDLNAPHNYSYSIRYKIANSKQDADLSFPYLIPLKPGVKVAHYGWTNTENINYSLTNSFTGSEGDTIYAIRKGVVTNVPMDMETDRIGKNTFEVIHADGTIALYTGLNPQRMFVSAGQRVYPGQPVGVLSNLNYVAISVYQISDIGLQALYILFATQAQEKESYSNIRGITVQHPLEIVHKELSEREKKKHTKNALYSSKD